MRPINSIIEFKQIIGRGTRLYDGKDYFTIYDYVKAHHHFSDPEWDGEPIEPEPREPREPLPRGPEIPEPGPLPEPQPRPQKIKIKLADGKARAIQNMTCTTYWHPDGKPMSAQEFMQMLFGKLPYFFKNEAELRAIWSAPDTRRKLLDGLAEKGFGRAQLAEMQKIIDAEKSDLFDALAHVAYALAPLTREERANTAKASIGTLFDEAAGAPRLRPLALCERWRGRARPGEAGPTAAAQVPQLHHGRSEGSRRHREDSRRVRGLPEIPLPEGCLILAPFLSVPPSPW